jgi:hypothetical protein
VLEKVLGIGAMRRWFTWLLRLLEYVLPEAILSCRSSGRWRLSGGVKPLGLDIWWSVDHPGIYDSGNGSSRVRLRGAWACPMPGYEAGP